jgi:hypothetical protein
MEGILIKKGARKVYMIDRDFDNKSSEAFGHNGLQVGDWWALQVAACRDGAHDRNSPTNLISHVNVD